MKEKRYVLFDLDGTLTDPAVGITRSVQHALAAFGICAEPENLLCFIGPPLIDSFETVFGFTGEEARQAVTVYREYFVKTGMFENEVYPGVVKVLSGLKKGGKRLYVATSKPEPFAKEILTHFKLDGFFDFIGGSTLDETRTRKGEVIRYVLKEAAIPEEEAVMVGDRLHDGEGAAETGLPFVGALYGYGSRRELENAGASAIAETPEELFSLLTGGETERLFWAETSEEQEDAFRIRQAVFVEEQGFQNEFDDRDGDSRHLILYKNGRSAGCCRIYPEEDGVWRLGRLAVRREFRKQGLGEKLLLEAERRIRGLGGRTIRLSAQVQAAGFYEKLGFLKTSDVYLEERCPHQDMEKSW